MKNTTPAFVRNTGTARGAVKFVMVAVVALTPFVLPQRADAQETFAADSDGYVPVYDVCFAGSEVGYYSWYNDGYTTYGEISIDSCLLESYGGGPADYDRVLAHEQGHAAGLGHSSDPNDIMYPYTYFFQGGGEQYEAPETEKYETEQYEEPTVEDEQYAMDLTSEVQQYDPGEEADAAEQAPVVREAPREERPAVRTENPAEDKKKAGDGKKAEERKKVEERKKAEERDEAVDRVRVEAAALAQAVDGADTLTKEEPGKQAEALARTLEEGKAGAKGGPLAEARTEAENMAGSLTEIEKQAGEPAPDRARTIAEAREKAEALAGALDRAGDNAEGDARPRDLDEAGADVRTVASDLMRAEKEIADQEAEEKKTEEQGAGAKPAEGERVEGQDNEQGVFVRIREFFASTFG